MLVREWCAPCARCATVTPHARQRLRGLALVVVLLGAGSLYLLASPEPRLAWLTGLPALALLFVERDRHLGTHCRRCRGRALAAVRRLRPSLRRTAFGDGP